MFLKSVANIVDGAENSNQAELDKLFARPSRRQRFKLVLALLAIFVLVPLIMNLPIGPLAPENPDDPPLVQRPVQVKPVADLRLPEEVSLAPKDTQRRELRDGINRLSRKLGVEQTLELADPDLVEAIGKLDRKIDERFGEKAPARKASDLASVNEPRRVLRALLWKHNVADYAEPTLNVAELLERLENALVAAKLIEKESP